MQDHGLGYPAHHDPYYGYSGYGTHRPYAYGHGYLGYGNYGHPYNWRDLSVNHSYTKMPKYDYREDSYINPDKPEMVGEINPN